MNGPQAVAAAAGWRVLPAHFVCSRSLAPRVQEADEAQQTALRERAEADEAKAVALRERAEVRPALVAATPCCRASPILTARHAAPSRGVLA